MTYREETFLTWLMVFFFVMIGIVTFGEHFL